MQYRITHNLDDVYFTAGSRIRLEFDIKDSDYTQLNLISWELSNTKGKIFLQRTSKTGISCVDLLPSNTAKLCGNYIQRLYFYDPGIIVKGYVRILGEI